MNYLVYTNTTSFDEAIRLLDNNGNGFLPIVNDNQVLIGIITDGDLRRGMLNKTLELEAIINKNPITALTSESRVSIKKRLRELHKRHMPVVNEKGQLVEVVILEEFENRVKENWVVIMAGGLGTRLGDLTRHIPKPMLEVNGKPMLLHIIERFKAHGFVKFFLCVNYKSDVIENYFGDGNKYGVQIKYTRETKRMGTAGALSLIEEKIEKPFFVVNGDVITSINYDDFLNFHTIQKADASMCIKRFAHEVPYACVEFDDLMNMRALKEKPSYDYYINAGMYILNPDCLNFLQKEEYFDMPNLFEVLMGKKKRIKTFTIDDYWLDIGLKDDYIKAQKLDENGATE